MTGDKLQRLVDDLATHAQPTRKAERAIAKHIARKNSAGQVEHLSKIEARRLPLKYQPLYERLLKSNPKRAKHLWNTASYIPLSEVEREVLRKQKLKDEQTRKAGEALARVQQGNELKRRV